MTKPGYEVFRLRTPNGLVLVRKLGTIALAAKGLVLSPLVLAAMKAAGDEEPSSANADPEDVVAAIVDAALVDPPGAEPVTAEDLPVIDRHVVYAWAISEEVAPAESLGTQDWREDDFLPLVESHAALLLDMTAKRYGCRPSALLALPASATVSLAIDLSLAYRALRTEAKAAKGEDDAEVEDVLGRKHRLPRKLVNAPPPVNDAPGIGRVMPVEAVHVDDMIMAYGGAFGITAGGGRETLDGAGQLHVR